MPAQKSAQNAVLSPTPEQEWEQIKRQRMAKRVDSLLRQLAPTKMELKDREEKRKILHELWKTQFARPGLTVELIPIQLGDQEAALVIYRRVGESGKENGMVMLNVHENEQSSVVAGLNVLEKKGGALIQLRHPNDEAGERNIPVIGDPNRLFFGIKERTQNIVEDEKKKLNWKRKLLKIGPEGPVAPSFSDGQQWLKPQGGTQWLSNDFDQAMRVKQAIREQIMAYNPKIVIALHNTNGINVGSFENVEKTHHGDAIKRLDFVYTTNPGIYLHLLKNKLNAVLQDNDKAAKDDDGSLSVFFGRTNIPYCNVEAASEGSDYDKRAGGDSLKHQTEMIETIYKFWDVKPKRKKAKKSIK